MQGLQFKVRNHNLMSISRYNEMNISELKSATEQYYLSHIKRLWLSSSEQGKCLYAGKGLIHSKELSL